jgi:hypothetical protein
MPRLRFLVLAVLVVASGCGGGGDDTAARDKCEASAGVGRCLERDGKWVPVGNIDGTTTTPAPPTTTPESTTTTTAPTTTTVGQLTGKGPLHVYWLYSPQMQKASKPPTDCGPMRGSYQVQVRDEADAIMTVATLDAGRYSRDPGADGNLGIRCTFTYTATVALRPAYTFVLSEGGKNERDRRTVSSETVRTAGAPQLSVQETYCPEC